MSTITSLVGTDGITTANSMTKINTNFSNLNTDKIETSTLDTDTTLAANSDNKIATQKAVKAYVDAGGNVNASTTTKGIVEEATVSEIGAGTAAGSTGARLFINPSSTVSTSAGAGDVGKIPRLNSSGKLDSTFITPPTITSGYLSHDISSNTTDTVAHGLSATPRLVKVTMLYARGAVSGSVTILTYSAGSSRSAYVAVASGTSTGAVSGTGNVWDAGNSIGSSVAIGAPDGTNFTITWSKSGSPTGTVEIIWEAFA